MVSAWNKFVKKIYDQNKSKPGYKFKDALKDAAPLWKKGEGAAANASSDAPAASSGKKTKKRGNKKSMSRGMSRGRARGMSRGRSRSRGRN
jgi:hypothetical protein